MSSIPTDILILVLLLLLNSLFVMSEMAVVSARKARLQQQANEGNKRAATALNLAQHPNTFLSTVQIGITLGQRVAWRAGRAGILRAIGSSYLNGGRLWPRTRICWRLASWSC